MRRAALGLVLIAALALSACSIDDSSTQAPDDDPGGVGMTYGGKLGTDLGGGLVLPYDGSGVRMGYGF